ncbi:MAG: hypothetical protein IPN76_19105 [Saprospiraceae bacterium]|nr:hypothetical protein [Saprospiraceae bacterium]
MKTYELNVGKMVIQFYLMMAIILVAGFTGQWWMTIFAFALVPSAILGIQLKASLPALPKGKIVLRPAL